MSQKKITTILFDFDGTLMSTDALVVKSFRYTLSQYGVKEVSDERLSRTFGGLMDDLMKEFIAEYHLDADYREMLAVYRAFQNERFDTETYMYDGIRELLEALRQAGYRMAVLTSRKKRSTLRGLSMFGLDGYFMAVQTADDTDAVKPDPRAAYSLLTRLGAQPEESLLIGDSHYDIQCGKNAGMYTALALWGRGMPETEQKALAPDMVLETPAAFLEGLQKLDG